MAFQVGDGHVVINNCRYGLRLTVGALAEISTRLSLFGPDTLMQGLRSLQAEEGRVLLESLMRPCLPPDGANPVGSGSPVARLTEADIAKALPAICEVFEHAFAD